ncbi:hypothetical protein [Bifidobacterium bohemicum]|uniref:hypothetical protein n=1 Tax=Bifidobacterium bohemicum TaxID=638617 RepID=UPI0011785D43|nr:hypothetical protein [Bifidobacterium bohemicum]
MKGTFINRKTTCGAHQRITNSFSFKSDVAIHFFNGYIARHRTEIVGQTFQSMKKGYLARHIESRCKQSTSPIRQTSETINVSRFGWFHLIAPADSWPIDCSAGSSLKPPLTIQDTAVIDSMLSMQIDYRF